MTGAKPSIDLLRAAAVTLMARYTVAPQQCIEHAIAQALERLSAHPDLADQHEARAAYAHLALGWRELLGLNTQRSAAH